LTFNDEYLIEASAIAGWIASNVSAIKKFPTETLGGKVSNQKKGKAQRWTSYENGAADKEMPISG